MSVTPETLDVAKNVQELLLQIVSQLQPRWEGASPT